MEVLPKDKTLVCSPAAARIAAEMGFKNVYELDHGKDMDFAEGRLNIRATVGMLLQHTAILVTFSQEAQHLHLTWGSHLILDSLQE